MFLNLVCTLPDAGKAVFRERTKGRQCRKCEETFKKVGDLGNTMQKQEIRSFDSYRVHFANDLRKPRMTEERPVDLVIRRS